MRSCSIAVCVQASAFRLSWAAAVAWMTAVLAWGSAVSVCVEWGAGVAQPAARTVAANRASNREDMLRFHAEKRWVESTAGAARPVPCRHTAGQRARDAKVSRATVTDIGTDAGWLRTSAARR